MKDFKVSFNNYPTKVPLNKKEIEMINTFTADNAVVINRDNIKSFFDMVGNKGCTFCPATFNGGAASEATLEQSQVIPLYFDTTDMSFEKVKTRADQCGLPILFSFDAFSVGSRKRLGVVFLSDTSVSEPKGVEVRKKTLLTIFPEADRDTDVTKLTLGGNKLLYADDTIPEITTGSLFRSMTYYLFKRYGATNYKRKITEFAKDNGLKQNRSKLIDVSTVDDPIVESRIADEDSSKSSSELNISNDPDFNKISPIPILLAVDHGEKLLNQENSIKSDHSVAYRVPGNELSSAPRETKIRRQYRSPAIKDLGRSCQLISEFQSATRKLTDNELLGIVSNLIQIESGSGWFRTAYSSASCYSDNDKERWEFNVSYLKQTDEEPLACDRFCSYKDTCHHGEDMLETAKPKQMMVKLANCNEVYLPVDVVQDNFRNHLSTALKDTGNFVHVIKAPTATGKTTVILDVMDSSQDRFILANPTNILKHETFGKAFKRKIWVTETPSLHELKSEIPKKVWERIAELYSAGRHQAVTPYINDILKDQKIPCLWEYQKQRRAFANFDGNVITTHRKLFCLDKERLNRYDHSIIDEDFIYKSYVSNQCLATVSAYEELMETTTNRRLARKIKDVLKLSKEKPFFTVESIDWDEKEDDDEDMPTAIDIPSFCKATNFCSLKAKEERDLKEDSIVFLKPLSLVDRSYIVVSATADETIYNYAINHLLGAGRVKFYDCGRAKYVGTLNQYHEKTMSRACIDKDPSVLGRIERMTGIKNMLTFKGKSKGSLWYGNCEGSNIYEGQDLNVVGTYHSPPWIYKLFAYSIGLDCDLAADMNSRVIERNGYKTKFHTFEDDILRNIQFWMIESESEQAIGRSRLARYDCTVNFFSNFPISQAIMNDRDY